MPTETSAPTKRRGKAPDVTPNKVFTPKGEVRRINQTEGN